ncbi:MAG: hypothetical protein ACREEA_11280 [Stellaceae bacterium]
MRISPRFRSKPAFASRWTGATAGWTRSSSRSSSSGSGARLEYEDIYIKGYADGREAHAGIGASFAFYNERRLHQALGCRAPVAVWREGVTGTLGENAVDIALRLDNAKGVVDMPTAAPAELAA